MVVYKALVYLIIDGEALTTTPEHPFLQADGAWTPAGKLAVGDEIRNADGEYGIVEAIEFAATPQVMYNMTVADAHTYTVGDGQRYSTGENLAKGVEKEQPLMEASGLTPQRPAKIGSSAVTYGEVKEILTKATGFMGAFDYSLNPYSGCTFGCTYCYAAFFVKEEDAQANWGHWLRVKENALELLTRKRKKPLTGKSIYMSSVTDPYQPIERKLELTRQILQELATYHNPRLVIQTRGPLVVRDIDLFKQFTTLQINMTVTTDDETVRRLFEPLCPSLSARLDAIRAVQEAGIPTCITLTPLLPVADPHHFAQRLVETGVPKFVVQPFHQKKGRFAAGTRTAALQLFAERQWDHIAYRQVVDVLKSYLPDVMEGKQGFAPI